MMGGASKLDRDWKEDLITNPPEEEEQDEDVPGSKELKELKADVVEAIDDGIRSKQGIVEHLDYPRIEIIEAISLLRGEGVLEVVEQ